MLNIMRKIYSISMQVFTFQLNQIKREKWHHTVFVSLAVEDDDVTIFLSVIYKRNHMDDL